MRGALCFYGSTPGPPSGQSRPSRGSWRKRKWGPASLLTPGRRTSIRLPRPCECARAFWFRRHAPQLASRCRMFRVLIVTARLVCPLAGARHDTASTIRSSGPFYRAANRWLPAPPTPCSPALAPLANRSSTGSTPDREKQWFPCGTNRKSLPKPLIFRLFPGFRTAAYKSDAVTDPESRQAATACG